MDSGSRELLHEHAIDWVVSRNRSLKAAILTGDQELVDQVVDDVAHVVGKRNAELWKITIMGEMVAQGFEGNDDQSSDIE